ncbi:hypothetical protein B7764_24305 (plasmid) [Pantoea ananatis]|uniref:hypothetical protein n=1 Tax=Pantoea ananas TaxID=553 RepID=UPI000B5FB446|nr:hypothetical protein [Pantoea ananatis]ASN18257.1 hypothetical protein B7764_24305 [Pantoea ananatis]
MNDTNRQFIKHLAAVMAATGFALMCAGLIWDLAGGKFFDALTDTPVFRTHPLLFSLLWHVPVWTLYVVGLGLFLAMLLIVALIYPSLLFSFPAKRSGRKRSRGVRFSAEERYTVLKETDVQHALSAEEVIQLAATVQKVREGRHKAGKKDLSCVVVEHDWPEYPVVWQMLEKRVNGEQKQ